MEKGVGILTVVFALLTSSGAFAATLANVNGKVISDADVRSALGGFNDAQRRQILNDSISRREIVSNLVEQELLIQEGEKAKLDQDAEYKTALEAFRRNYLSQKVLAKNVAPKLTDKAAKAFYDSNKRKYGTDKVQAQHILLADEKTAREILAQAKAPGADFQKLAEKNSRDPSAKNNRGDIGIVTWDSPFVEEFKEAAFDGKVGEIVGPVKTLYGYHLIKIIDKKLGKPLAFDEVELKVRQDLKQDLILNYVTDLRKQSKISLDEKAIDKL